jgi:hypothetical protein
MSSHVLKREFGPVLLSLPKGRTAAVESYLVMRVQIRRVLLIVPSSLS